VTVTVHEETGSREGPYQGQPRLHVQHQGLPWRLSDLGDSWLVPGLLMPQASCICNNLKLQSWNLVCSLPNGITCAPALRFPQPWKGRIPAIPNPSNHFAPGDPSAFPQETRCWSVDLESSVWERIWSEVLSSEPLITQGLVLPTIGPVTGTRSTANPAPCYGPQSIPT